MLRGEINHDIALKIIEKMSDGTRLTEILAPLELSPFRFYRYINSYMPLFREYTAAQQSRAELLVEEIIDIADNEPDPHKARVRTDVRRWYASKMQPNKYGDRIDVNVTQTVDITQALTDARARTLLPDVEITLPIKSIESTEIDIFS